MIGTVEVLLLLALASAHKSLDQAARALSDFRPEEAVALLTRAKEEGPYAHDDHVRLYEQLGIAYAYLERSDDAKHAFDIMLALEPTRAISYTLSPKVTFLFEQARASAALRPTPTIDLSWSRDLTVEDRIPIAVEVVADPHRFLEKARVRFRTKGNPTWQEQMIELPEEGSVTRIELPPAAPGSEQTEAVELYAIAYDEKDNEVLVWGSEKRPREIGLQYEAPDPWYGQWWVWVVAGAVVAAGAGTAVFVVTREPPDTSTGHFGVRP
jgi:tetratricopeptide (TPR) repeat protein